MSLQLNIFRSPDSKYFIRTANRIIFVPLITVGLVLYSIWMYMDINYYFFTSKGMAISDTIKEAFIDHLVLEQIDALPWVGLFFIMVYFLGLFLAHLVLRPFKVAAVICQEAIEGASETTQIKGLMKHQLVVKAVLLLTDFIATRDHAIPPELAKISKPKLDKVFYLQYFLCMSILSIITAVAVYVGIHHLHESIVGSATLFLKTDSQVASFLVNQRDLVSSMGMACTIFSLLLYLLIARGLVRDVEGVSYGYLRDVRKVIEGDYGRRLQPRSVDPGTEAAISINRMLDHYFPNKVVATSEEPPPPLVPKS